MVSIKLAVLKHTRAKNGTYKIRISIGHKSETHYIVTKYRVQSFRNFVNGQVVNQPDAAAINIKLRKLLTDYDERLERIPNPSDFSCQQLRDMLEEMRPNITGITLRQMTKIITDEMRKEGRLKTAFMREYHIDQFCKFYGGDIILQNLTHYIISDYVIHLRNAGKSVAYTGMLVGALRAVINRGVRDGLVRYDIHPMAYYKEIKAEPHERDITVEEMRLIRDYQPPKKGERRSRDIFMLSYYLGGTNLIDLLSHDFRKRDLFEYVRTKTKNRKSSNRVTSFSIPPEALPIIDRYMNPKTGLLDFRLTCKYETFMQVTTREIKHIAMKLGVKDWQKVSFYTARKSFVQHGFDLGCSLEVLEYCIGESMKSNRPIFNYLKVMRKHADFAIRMVLDNLNEKSGDPHGQPDKPI